MRESKNCCNHFRWNPSQIGAHLHLCWRFSMLNSDKPQVEVPFTHLCLCTACCLLRLGVARARYQCLSAFSGLGFCRYLYPTHLELATHPLTYESPYFTQSCSPPTYQSRVSAVITCVCIYLCSPHPVPKSRIRVQSGWETRSPPAFSSSSCYRADSLPDYNSFFCILPWGMK